jgi:hypothetical protein
LTLLKDSQPPDKRIAVFFRHPNVTNKYIRPSRENTLHRFGPGSCHRNRCSSHFQQPFHESARVEFIVNHQHVNIGEGYFWQRLVLAESNPGMAFLVRTRKDGDEREADSKGAPLPDPAAFDADVAAMQLDQLLDNSQSKSQPTMSTSCRRISLLKPFENIRQKIRCDAFTGISDADFHV